MVGLEPLWRAAPTRLLRRPGWSVLLAATAAILAAAAASIPLFDRSVAAAAVQAETSGAEPGAAPYESTGLRVTLDGVPPPDADAGLRAYLSSLPALGEPVVTSQGIAEQRGRQGATPFVQANGRRERATLYYRDDAIDTLAASTSTPAVGGGIWLPGSVATALAIAPGDELEVGLDLPGTAPDRFAPTTLAGVYASTADSPLPVAGPRDTWLTSDRDLPPRRERRYSSMAFADRATYDQLIVDVGEIPIWFADMRLVDDPRPEQAERAAAAINALGRAAFTPGAVVADLVAQAQPEGTSLTVTSGLPRAVSRATTTATLAQEQARSLAVGGLALGIGAVAGATALLHLGRRGEQELGARLGVHPAAAGALTAVEAFIPVGIGSAGGAVIAWALVRLLGPSPELGTGIAAVVLASAAATLAVTVAVTFVTGAATFAVLSRPSGNRLGRARLKVPWELAVVAAALVTGIAVVDAGPGAPGILSVAFPAIAALAIGAVALRLLGAVARRAPAPAPVGSVRWLSARRARRAGSDVTATVLVLSVGAALLLWGLTVQRGVSAGLHDKVAAGSGARTVAMAGQSWVTSPPDANGLVSAPLPDSTWVWRRSAALPPRFGQLDLLAVDPSTFVSVALPGGDHRSPRGRSRRCLSFANG